MQPLRLVGLELPDGISLLPREKVGLAIRRRGLVDTVVRLGGSGVGLGGRSVHDGGIEDGAAHGLSTV